MIIEALTFRNLRAAQVDAIQNGDVDVQYNFVVSGGTESTAVGRGWTQAFSNRATPDTIKIGVAASPLLPRTWARVVNLVECGVRTGAIASDYQLVVDKEQCDQSLSARFQKVVQLVISNSDQLPRLAC